MNRELLAMLTLDDLKGETRELAEVIGLEAFKLILERYGGTGRLYIPQPDMVIIPIRDLLIQREYNGFNIYELAKKWELSDTYIRQIVKEQALDFKRKPMDGQISLLDEISEK
ncbi:MAG: Mor transcription activator family protein [Christensenella sp.]